MFTAYFMVLAEEDSRWTTTVLTISSAKITTPAFSISINLITYSITSDHTNICCFLPANLNTKNDNNGETNNINIRILHL